MTKKKKEKVIYVDDGRSLADMSAFRGNTACNMQSKGSAKDRWNTYWGAVRMMFGPMLVVIVGLCVIYMITWFLFSVA